MERSLGGGVSRNKVRLLFGARQTGKTMLLRHLTPDGETYRVDLQDGATRRRFEADPAAFGREIRGLGKHVRHVVVDEIQKVPALLDEIQALHDRNPQRWQLYLTGSSARRLRRGSANLLPGRSHSYALFPVCRWEVDTGAPSQIAPPRSRGRARVGGKAPPFPRRSMESVLQRGSLPGVQMESAATAQATLDSYVELYLEEEIRREALVRDMGPFIVFLRLAATESGRQVNLTRLSQESGVPASTLKTYYQVLVDTFVGYWMPAYSRRARKRLLVTPRFYLFDVGVRNAAAEMVFGGRLAEPVAGPLLESWVAQELLARSAYSGRGYRVSFWRQASGVEVDFVWESPREDLPVEVKWTTRPRAADARHLERFLDQHPDRARRGLLVCRCPQAQQLTDRVRAIPWEEL